MFNLAGRSVERQHGIVFYLVKWVTGVQAIAQRASGSSLLLFLLGH